MNQRAHHSQPQTQPLQLILSSYPVPIKRRIASSLKAAATALDKIAGIKEVSENDGPGNDTSKLPKHEKCIADALAFQEEHFGLLVTLGSLSYVNAWGSALRRARRESKRKNEVINSDTDDAGKRMLLTWGECAARARRWGSRIEESIPETVDIFLSYCSDNKQCSDNLHQQLESNGYSVYYAERTSRPGVLWDDELIDALLDCSEVWLLLTEESLLSQWVTTEWGLAWGARKPIVPVLLGCKVTDLPDRLRRYRCEFYQDLESAIERLKSRLAPSRKTQA